MSDYSYISEFLNYEPTTGKLYWKTDRRKVKPGQTAGTINNYGYVQVYINRKFYFAHKLAWLLYYGRWPRGQIDHIDHDRTNNKIENLREVDHYENHKNKSKPKNNNSGFTGISWHKKAKKWRVRVQINQKEVHLGTFENLKDAVSTRNKYLSKFGYHKNHGV